MSYAIEYARQFIRSEEGITPCWLVGDNNVTEGRGRYERRVRNWSCFYNLVGTSEDEIMDRVQSCLGGFQEHWRRNGKWVDDKGLINWVKSGVRSAASIEDILQRNPECGGSVRCYVHVWHGFEHTIMLDTCVATTDDFDNWIQKYRDLKASFSGEKVDIYPCVDFGTEKIRHPIQATDDDRFFLRKNKRYLTKLSGNESCWSIETDSALTFSYADATNLIRENWFVSDASLVKVPKEQGPVAIIRITEGMYAGRYVYEATPRRLRMSEERDARRYSSPQSAQSALNRILKKYPRVTGAEVITI